MKSLKLMLYVAIIFLINSCSQDKKEWKNTLEINSVQAYEEYVDKYPDSKYADSAKNRIWKNTIAMESINAYEEYIDKYPDSKYADSVKNRIWKKTISIESIKAFEKYIDKYPRSAFVDSAKIRIKDLTYTRGALYAIGVSFTLDDAFSGEIKKLYYEKDIVLKKTDGKKIRAICPISLINNLKGGQMLEVEFDKELNKYKVIKVIEDPK
jgi:hypothetical protein